MYSVATCALLLCALCLYITLFCVSIFLLKYRAANGIIFVVVDVAIIGTVVILLTICPRIALICTLCMFNNYYYN